MLVLESSVFSPSWRQGKGFQRCHQNYDVVPNRFFALRIREEQGGSIKKPNVDVLVASVGENMMKDRMRLTRLLWEANISAEFSQQENPKLKYELANALDRGIPFMVIVGEEEINNNTCKVKDLAARTEDTVSLGDLVKTLRKKGVIPVGCEFAAELLQSETES